MGALDLIKTFATVVYNDLRNGPPEPLLLRSTNSNSMLFRDFVRKFIEYNVGDFKSVFLFCFLKLYFSQIKKMVSLVCINVIKCNHLIFMYLYFLNQLLMTTLLKILVTIFTLRLRFTR